jgi:excisionase family DNA binding protein
MARRTLFRSVLESEVLTLEEVATYLRVSRKTTYRMARSGDLPAFKAANHWRVRRAELVGWIARQMASRYSP